MALTLTVEGSVIGEIEQQFTNATRLSLCGRTLWHDAIRWKRLQLLHQRYQLVKAGSIPPAAVGRDSSCCQNSSEAVTMEGEGGGGGVWPGDTVTKIAPSKYGK